MPTTIDIAVPRPARLPRALGTRMLGLLLGLMPLAVWPQAPSQALERGLLDAVNLYREDHGLAPLQPDEALQTLAAAHSQDMARQQRLHHDGFDHRFRRAGRTLCAENLAARHDHPDEVLAAWRASPSHQANLLQARLRQVGIALVDGHLTLLACTPAAGTTVRR